MRLFLGENHAHQLGQLSTEKFTSGCSFNDLNKNSLPFWALDVTHTPQ